MPQGKLNCPGTMPKGKKKVPFSGKQKKEQLAEKRKRKQSVSNFGDNEQHVTKSNDRVEEPEEAHFECHYNYVMTREWGK